MGVALHDVDRESTRSPQQAEEDASGDVLGAGRRPPGPVRRHRLYRARARRRRRAVPGFELYPEWADLARRRIAEQLPAGADPDAHEIRTGDALSAYGSVDDASIAFVLTSPPYWSILKEIDKLVRETRVAEGLAHEYGRHVADVGRERPYSEYLDDLALHAAAWRHVQRPGRYASALVGDFRHGPYFHVLHAGVAALLERAGLTPSGLFVIVQRNPSGDAVRISDGRRATCSWSWPGGCRGRGVVSRLREPRRLPRVVGIRFSGIAGVSSPASRLPSCDGESV